MELSAKELTLYLQCSNEVLRGLRIDNFEDTLGVPYTTLLEQDRRLRHLLEASSQDRFEVIVHPYVIAETLRELEDGVHEFQMRTGFEVSEAEAFLQKVVEASDK